MVDTVELSWTTKLLYLLGLIFILLFGALVVYLICYLTSKDDDDQDSTEGDDNVTRRRANKRVRGATTNRGWKGMISGKNIHVEGNKNSPDSLLIAAGKQTMSSTLTRSVKDSDVIVASAISSIPLRDLGGSENNDIVVDVNQQMYLNKEIENREEPSCIVCKARKEIAWDKIVCFAQTTIGVIVYKRTPETKQQATPAASNSTLPPTSIKDTCRSDSILTIAPTPDSRLGRL